jgi:hypothetical protein
MQIAQIRPGDGMRRFLYSAWDHRAAGDLPPPHDILDALMTELLKYGEMAWAIQALLRLLDSLFRQSPMWQRLCDASPHRVKGEPFTRPRNVSGLI